MARPHRGLARPHGGAGADAAGARRARPPARAHPAGRDLGRRPYAGATAAAGRRAAGRRHQRRDRILTRAPSIQVESDSALVSLILSMILSEKSATFRDHALRGGPWKA